jgi:hypothetical protein
MQYRTSLAIWNFLLGFDLSKLHCSFLDLHCCLVSPQLELLYLNQYFTYPAPKFVEYLMVILIMLVPFAISNLQSF